MTEKRFILHEHDSYGDAIEDTMTGDWLDSAYQYTNKLNELNDENEQLKSEKQAIIDILNEMENGDYFWDRDYLIDRISDIETTIGVDFDD